MAEKSRGALSSFLSNFGNSIGLTTQEELIPEYQEGGDFDYVQEDVEDETQSRGWWQRNKDRPARPARTTTSARSSSHTQQQPQEEPLKLVNNPPVALNQQMMLYQPETFKDMHSIIDNLRAMRPIIVNVEKMSEVGAQRVVDILAGAVYALSGQIRHVSRCIFVLTPPNMDFGGNMIEPERDPNLQKGAGTPDGVPGIFR